MRYFRFLAVLAALLTLTPRASAQAPQYTLELLPGWSTSINDSNMIPLVKTYDATRVVGGLFNASTGQFTPLTIAMPEIHLTDISNAGWVAGIVRPAGGTRTIVAWNPSLVRATIQQSAGPTGRGPHVNSSGRVAWSDNPTGSTYIGYSWAPFAGVTTNAALNSVAGSLKAVTPEGWILGTAKPSPTQATYVSASGITHTIPLPPNATRCEGMDANARGQFLLASVHSQAPGLRTYAWNRSNGALQLLANPVTGRSIQVGNRFNDIGDCIGIGFVSSSPFPEPVLWVSNNAYAFRELLGGSYPTGWTSMNVPLDINNRGVIVGWGTYNGQSRYFVMKPVLPWHL